MSDRASETNGETNTASKGALSHMRVLDLSRILAGPWASQILGDLGADVIKIERPETGDDTRGWGPPYLDGPNGREGSDAAYFACANRNKRSLAIDITSSEGQALIHRLVAEADVVLENFKVGGLAKYGLDYESLKAIKPDLVYCSITGFGQTGPDAMKAGYDFMIQAMGGLMSVTGQPEGTPGGGPVKVGVALVDIMTGLYATIGILAALAHRQQTGEGQYIDLALLDVQVAALANQATNYLVSGRAPTQMGNSHPNLMPYSAFPSSDGHFIIAIGNDAQFARFCSLAGLEALVADERFATNRARVKHREALAAKIAAVTVDHPAKDWLTRLNQAGIPCGPINSIDQVFAEPQVIHRGMHIALERSDGTRVPSVASPIRMSATPATYTTAPPQLGEHSHAILAGELGLSEDDIERLIAGGVVGKEGS
ncbi:Crotonobetainyl-CoA:carnitine CoA-transferase CaiB [Cohaesibacter sp. ES.047]|uniref:CaiB/BaiF CoA transferase family protein n=1 Tax=Cohaesibacter sp. ES.047 TaxID=1798205 RepID=UPI000BB8617C|nr:CaiB/BaiF CoA-transferase family protein [Cohaesibacter sp. ES.047]SNY90770.1 Crotonobetainyl-CoA:carnitine CoA-transferase CaiB [Cohaesibacter sp. ES.047]